MKGRGEVGKKRHEESGHKATTGFGLGRRERGGRERGGRENKRRRGLGKEKEERDRRVGGTYSGKRRPKEERGFERVTKDRGKENE